MKTLAYGISAPPPSQCHGTFDWKAFLAKAKAAFEAE